MIVVLSPSKTLDFDVPLLPRHTTPELLSFSSQLIGELKKLSVKEICKLMELSEKLGVLNYERYHHFSTPFSPENAKQAIAVFKGDVYDGLEAHRFSAKDLQYAQEHLRILSGLYGILRPLDLIQAYRLEMGTKLKNIKGKDLYSFWGKKITAKINELLVLAKQPSCLINLASNEYFKVIHPKEIKGEIITPVFKEKKGDQYKIVMIYAKRARGKMASYIIGHQLKNPSAIKDFNEDGYEFCEKLSTEKEWIFVR